MISTHKNNVDVYNDFKKIKSLFKLSTEAFKTINPDTALYVVLNYWMKELDIIKIRLQDFYSNYPEQFLSLEISLILFKRQIISFFEIPLWGDDKKTYLSEEIIERTVIYGFSAISWAYRMFVKNFRPFEQLLT